MNYSIAIFEGISWLFKNTCFKEIDGCFDILLSLLALN